MNNQDRIGVGYGEWELGSHPNTRFHLVYSEVFIDKIWHGCNLYLHLGIGVTAGASDGNLLSGKRIFVIPEQRIDGWQRRWNKRRQLFAQEYFSNRDQTWNFNIPDQFICKIHNLICEKVPG